MATSKRWVAVGVVLLCLLLIPTVQAQDLQSQLSFFLNGLYTGQMRLRGTAPSCSTNCGTSPSITGSDSAMVVTMGATGSPASGWVVTFNGTWASAPSCAVTSAKTGMAVGKIAIAVVTTTTTITVTTNGTAPANADVYAIQCFGVT